MFEAAILWLVFKRITQFDFFGEIRAYFFESKKKQSKLNKTYYYYLF